MERENCRKARHGAGVSGIGRLLLTVIMAAMACSGAWGADSPREALERFAASPAISRGSAAIYVRDLKSGEVIASLNPDKPLVPASIMKTVTIATLLGETGPEWEYVTRVMRDGRVKDGVLEGNLVVEGSGDPSLGSAYSAAPHDFAAEIAEALRREGIRRVTGSVIIDESVFAGPSCPPTWAAGDLSHAYGTGSHGFNYADNSTGGRSVSDPAARFRTQLRTALGNAGITVEGLRMNSEGRRHTLYEHRSGDVAEIMRSCMMRSDNMYAESMLRTYDTRKGGDGSTDSGARRETELWRGRHLPMEGVNIVDGSGLSRANRVTARFMDGVLEHMKDDVDYASFMPLAGQEGTLRKFLAGTPLDSYMAMKTGSMNGIQCYAGYKLDEEFAPTHSVVVILNALPAGRAAAKDAVARLLLDLFGTPGEAASAGG